ncbi:SUMF1/EgtB/PvdO family nonheme iron enzyme [Leptolyngbya sp. Heron Island J]|uniref:SUMF1/EgtB/PvdO family nonheme iron enzyme n=1 Tax=Leptolyngbya sp. Heron Island J TaxID=1385935 RepID=UPI002E13C619
MTRDQKGNLRRDRHHRLRGGSWNNNPDNCRSANRNRNDLDNYYNNIGFRVVCFPPSTLHSQSWWMGIHQACRKSPAIAPVI